MTGWGKRLVRSDNPTANGGESGKSSDNPGVTQLSWWNTSGMPNRPVVGTLWELRPFPGVCHLGVKGLDSHIPSEWQLLAIFWSHCSVQRVAVSPT
jgi:hypothetical protein